MLLSTQQKVPFNTIV